ncbi:HAMP domain-containing histidine kinase [Paenibacillus sp. IB182496]|uniref:histidine kinase n=1 Tax=Paenibacillus sabuli TaxID=2772509 RepID=A0A927GV49_9BACL|nr:HAMP domain-containing sensor histidine kinase [Paenibacillus sabuli]MBD2848387.1 HAMP domain-containing histidine kinase [Paenibacillus sabuli]
MSRLPHVLHFALNALWVIALLLLGWTGAYYATGSLYARIGWEPHGLLALLANAALGFLAFGVAMMLIGHFFVRSGEHQFWSELIEAIRRISRGDFQVSVASAYGERQRQRHPLGKLVDSINDMAANLQAMEELRQEFISNVSHEIGTPLTSISGFARALRDERLEAAQRERYLTIIEEECGRLAQLSDNLLKLAVLDADRQPLHPISYRLDKQLATVMLASEPQWEAKGIELDLQAAELEIVADQALLAQVWANLVHNAVKFTPPGGSVSVRLEQAAGRAVVRVADTGPGIAEADRARIFERFYKADASRTRAPGSGSGLGLSIAHKIVTMHGGRIVVDTSLPGEGAVFTVSLPLDACPSSLRASAQE